MTTEPYRCPTCGQLLPVADSVTAPMQPLVSGTPVPFTAIDMTQDKKGVWRVPPKKRKKKEK